MLCHFLRFVTAKLMNSFLYAKQICGKNLPHIRKSDSSIRAFGWFSSVRLADFYPCSWPIFIRAVGVFLSFPEGYNHYFGRDTEAEGEVPSCSGTDEELAVSFLIKSGILIIDKGCRCPSEQLELCGVRMS